MPEEASLSVKEKRTRAPLPFPAGVLRPAHAAEYIGLSLATLARMRCDGGGPEVTQLNKKAIGYTKASLDAWLSSRPRYRSTSERTVASTAA